MERKRYRQLLGLLVAIVFPSIAIAVLGWQVLDQQSELDQTRADERRKEVAFALGTELRDQLNSIEAKEIASTNSADAYTDPSVMLVAWAEGDKLVLPWESEQPDPEPYSRAETSLTRLADDVRALFPCDRKPDMAVKKLRDEIAKRRDPIESLHLLNVLAGLLKQWEGHEQEAYGVYVELLSRSEAVDDSPNPKPFWHVYPADVLIRAKVREREVLTRIEQDLGSFETLARWSVELRRLLVQLQWSPDPEVQERAKDNLETLDRRMERLETLRGLPQIHALQAAFSGLDVTAERWSVFGEDELWLVGRGPHRAEGLGAGSHKRGFC